MAGVLGAADVELFAVELGGRVASRLWLGDSIDYVTCGYLPENGQAARVGFYADPGVRPEGHR